MPNFDIFEKYNPSIRLNYFIEEQKDSYSRSRPPLKSDFNSKEEAEEWVKENMDCCKTDNSVNQSIPYFDEERCCAKSAFQDGAELGYNKAKEEMQAQIEKMKLCQNCKFEDIDFLEEPCRNCSRLLGEDIKREDTSDEWELEGNDKEN